MLQGADIGYIGSLSLVNPCGLMELLSIDVKGIAAVNQTYKLVFQRVIVVFLMCSHCVDQLFP